MKLTLSWSLTFFLGKSQYYLAKVPWELLIKARSPLIIFRAMKVASSSFSRCVEIFFFGGNALYMQSQYFLRQTQHTVCTGSALPGLKQDPFME